MNKVTGMNNLDLTHPVKANNKKGLRIEDGLTEDIKGAAPPTPPMLLNYDSSFSTADHGSIQTLLLCCKSTCKAQRLAKISLLIDLSKHYSNVK